MEIKHVSNMNNREKKKKWYNEIHERCHINKNKNIIYIKYVTLTFSNFISSK